MLGTLLLCSDCLVKKVKMICIQHSMLQSKLKTKFDEDLCHSVCITLSDKDYPSNLYSIFATILLHSNNRLL